jgi:hypothetical protein
LNKSLQSLYNIFRRAFAMNQYFKPLVGLMIIGLVSLSGLSLSAVAQNQTSGNQTGGSDNMTAGGGNMTLQEEGMSGVNKTVARNQSVGGGGAAPS